MAKKKQAGQELSLFDDSFFNETPVSQEGIQRMGYLDDIRHPLELPKRKQAFHAMLDKMEEELKHFNSDNAEKVTVFIPKNTNDEETADTRQRAKKRRIKVLFADGTEFCDSNATTTMIQAIEKIGVERVASLGLEVCHIPLVAQEVNQKYASWTKPMSNSWYLMAQSDTKQKYMQLKSIITQLSIEATVQLGDFDAISATSHARKRDTRKKKAQLSVTFPNDIVLQGEDPLHTYVMVINHIGLERIKKTNIKIGGSPITTPHKKYNGQVKLDSGEWLTVPVTVKDKYKILRVISSLTHEPFEVMIID